MSLITQLTVVCSVLLFAVVAAKSIPSVDHVNDVIIVDNIESFAKEHPGLDLMPLIKEKSLERSLSVRYNLGARVTNDRLVAQGTDTFSYPEPNDVSLELTYPENGPGAILTYVEIVATQSNDEGNAYVANGGIGQRFIVIIMEAKNTDYFSYKAQYFGMD